MRAPLSVRIDDGFRSRNVTRQTTGLRFRKTAPGGHHSASMQVTLPHDAFTDLGPADRAVIYNGVTAETLWEGYTENPGVIDGPGGQSYDISAMGGVVLASDEQRPVVYLDYSFEDWDRDTILASAPSAITEIGTRPTDGREGIYLQLQPGQPVGSSPSSRAQMAYSAIERAGMTVGAVTLAYQAGVTDSNYTLTVAVGTSAAYTANALAASASTTAGAVTLIGNGVDFAAGSTRLAVNLRRSAGGATNVANDNTWATFTSLRVAGQRVDRFGVPVTLSGAYTVLASEVVEDLVGRLLGAVCDAATATIEATAYNITHLAFKEAVAAREVLDALGLYHPDFVWEILEALPNGKHRFNWRKWPTTPRYEISTSDGYDAPGGEADLCNRMTVTFTDGQGKPRSVTVSSVVPELGARVRHADPINLSGVAAVADAERIGQQILASKERVPRAATAKVRRPIIDHLTGRRVMPWEIEPGYLVRVRETGEDLRLTEMEYEDDALTTTLTLGDPVLTTEQRLAQLWASQRRAVA